MSFTKPSRRPCGGPLRHDTRRRGSPGGVVLSFRSELADTFRLYRTAFAFFRLARVEAEALARHHGSEGVAIARAREAQSAGAPRVERLDHWPVRLLADRNCRSSVHRTCRTHATSPEIYGRGRPGQMIIHRTGPDPTPSLRSAGGAAPRAGPRSAPQRSFSDLLTAAVLAASRRRWPPPRRRTSARPCLSSMPSARSRPTRACDRCARRSRLMLPLIGQPGRGDAAAARAHRFSR